MSFDVLEGCLDPDYMVVIKKLSFSIVVCKRDESSLSSVFWLNLRLHHLILTYHSRVECNLSGLRTHQMLWNILLMKSCKNLAILLVIAKLLYFINLIDGNLSTESRIFQKEANVVEVHLIVKRFKIFKSFYEKKKTEKNIQLWRCWSKCLDAGNMTNQPKIHEFWQKIFLCFVFSVVQIMVWVPHESNYVSGVWTE